MDYQKFAEIPLVYDTIQFFFGKSIIDHRLQSLIGQFKLNQSSVVLDLGGGTGLNCHLIHQTEHYLCLDLDFEKLATSLRRHKKNCSILANACGIPLRTHSVDLILLTAVTHHIPDTAIPTLFSEILRVLTPVGHFLLFDPIVDRHNPLGRFFLQYDLGAFPRTATEMDQFLLHSFDPITRITFRILHSYLLFAGAPHSASRT
jgi:ubiquinone/menaquinone biosynthesis C-methylase UbiE